MTSTARPLLSAIIINWNGGRWSPRLLDSLLPQLRPFSSEVLVVDNASTDDSVGFVRAHYPQVVAIPGTENRGYAAGVNIGLARARGEWILVLNTDLEFPPDSVAALLRAAQSRPYLGLAGPVLRDDNGVIAYSYGYEADERVMLARMFKLHQRNTAAAARDMEVRPTAEGPAVQPVPYLVGACLLVRRDALKVVGPMDENFFMYSEDVDWCRRFRAAGWDVCLLRTTYVTHSGGGSSDKPADALPIRTLGWSYTSMDLFARKHYGRYRAMLIRSICALTYAKNSMSLWIRYRLPPHMKGAIVLDEADYIKTLASYRSMLRILIRLWHNEGRYIGTRLPKRETHCRMQGD